MKRHKETTDLGENRTGIATNPAEARKTFEGAQVEATPGNEKRIAEMRILTARESQGIGSLPEPVNGANGSRRLARNGAFTALLDKLGERAAFERTGVRLYEAFLAKLQSHGLTGTILEEARRIRNQELEHFHVVCKEIRDLGGDETAMSPCADATGVASRGLLQVLCDPRTTIGQCISALLTAELTDNAGWDLLIGLCESLELDSPVSAFETAREQERDHLARIRTWLLQDLSEKFPKLRIQPHPESAASEPVKPSAGRAPRRRAVTRTSRASRAKSR